MAINIKITLTPEVLEKLKKLDTPEYAALIKSSMQRAVEQQRIIIYVAKGGDKRRLN